MLVDAIVDIRENVRAKKFWTSAQPTVDQADELIFLHNRPRKQCGFSLSLAECKRIWDLIQILRCMKFDPLPGDEIMIRYGTGDPHNGTHRAAALQALNLPVPAIIVDNWSPEDRMLPRWRRNN